MPPIPKSVKDVVESGRLAHLVTLNPDGGPQITCVWVGIDGDEIVMAPGRGPEDQERHKRFARELLYGDGFAQPHGAD